MEKSFKVSTVMKKMGREDYPYCVSCGLIISDLIVEEGLVVYRCFHCGDSVEVKVYES